MDSQQLGLEIIFIRNKKVMLGLKIISNPNKTILLELKLILILINCFVRIRNKFNSQLNGLIRAKIIILKKNSGTVKFYIYKVLYIYI